MRGRNLELTRCSVLPQPGRYRCPPRQPGETQASLQSPLHWNILQSLPALASPVTAFATNDVHKVHMGEHRMAVHSIRQWV